MTFLTQEFMEKFVELGTEEQINNLHGKILGRTMTLVHIEAVALYIRVLPTRIEGKIPSPAVWATVYLVDDRYTCMVNHLPEGKKHTKHSSLRSAVRHARKVVGEYAEKPERGWTSRLKREPLDSLYPTEKELITRKKIEKDYCDNFIGDFLKI